jgi:triacylglycerol esterase/lipase EstA (alpha/beta hydrolase family)
MRNLLALAVALFLLGNAGAASAQRRFIAYIHGRGGDRTGQSQTQLENEYWSRGDTYSSFTNYSSAGSVITRIGYDGTASFCDARASGEVANRLNDFIAANGIQAGELVLVGHSMGGLVVRNILNQGVPNSAYYNRVCSGGEFANGSDVSIPDNNANGVYSSVNVTSSSTINGPVEFRVDLRHTYVGDLALVLQHAGRSVTIWNRAGGSADDIHSTMQVTGFEGTSMSGTWTLWVRDLAGADVGYIDYISVRDQVRDFANIVSRVGYAVTVQTPHSGTEAADAMFGEADSLYSDAVGGIVTMFGVDSANASANYMRRSVLSAANGSWMSDGGRTRRIYTIAGFTTFDGSGNGESEDGLLALAWGGICNRSHAVNLWLCGEDDGEQGDGLVEEDSAAGRRRHYFGGDWYALYLNAGWQWDDGMAGARTDWLRVEHNHHQGRHDQLMARIRNCTQMGCGWRSSQDSQMSQTYWVGSYIGQYIRNLAP